MNDVKELEHDFEDALKEVDFSAYSPYSREYMKALFIGQMWELMKELHGEIKDENSECEDIEEELDGAKKYHDVYKRTGDVQFKDMASDELRHAGILIKKHQSGNLTSEKAEKLNELEKKRQEMLKMLSKES